MEDHIRELHKALVVSGAGVGDLVSRWQELRGRSECVNEENRLRTATHALEQEVARLKKENRQNKKKATEIFDDKEARAREVKTEKELRNLREEVKRKNRDATEKMQARGRAFAFSCSPPALSSLP